MPSVAKPCDKKHEPIRRRALIETSVRGSQVFDELRDEDEGRDFWADTVYCKETREE